jgi:CO/xanthine dehydrogenase Mo-binding subunit
MVGGKMAYIGQPIPRVDVEDKATGKALYPGDFNLPNQVYMKILFANRPHAIIKAIDTGEAQAIEGVLAVITARDVPVNEYGLIMPDQPVLCGPGSDKPYADRVRFVGDQVALVIAESEKIAAQAIKHIKVTYEDLPVVDSIGAALAEDAVLLHPDKGSNLFWHDQIRYGDVEAAFNQCDVIIEGEYRTPMQEHAYLQPEAGIAYYDPQGRISVIVAGQWTHEDQEQIAHALNLPRDQIRVIYPAIGGAFGGREDMSVQIVLALAVKVLHERGINRPVKTIWSREESIIGHHKRHAYEIKTKWGATRDGKILAVDVDINADGGAYAYTSTKVLHNATLMCSGPYEVPNVRVNANAIYTNHVPGGAFRGFGGPQGAFSAEMQMNKLAEALGMDPVDIRMKNLFKEGSFLPTNTPLPAGVTIRPVTEAVAKHAGWLETENGWQSPPALKDEGVIKRGKGIACAYKNVGFSFGAPESCSAIIELQGDKDIEHVILHHAGADVGQGAHSAIKQFAAEALNVPLEKVELLVSDTAFTGDSGSASASRMTFMSGNSIIGAAEKALEKWRAGERPVKEEYIYRPPSTTPYDTVTGACFPNFSYGYVAEVVELEVDTETGEIRLLKVVCGDDVGKAINPMQVVGQIEGGVVQAAGYVLMENFIQKDGYVLTNMLSNYLIPTVLDVPETVDSLVLEFAEPIGPFGARGMAEMPYLPLAPAIMDALHDATGVWFDEFPLVPEHVLRTLGKLG